MGVLSHECGLNVVAVFDGAVAAGLEGQACEQADQVLIDTPNRRGLSMRTWRPHGVTVFSPLVDFC